MHLESQLRITGRSSRQWVATEFSCLSNTWCAHEPFYSRYPISSSLVSWLDGAKSANDFVLYGYLTVSESSRFVRGCWKNETNVWRASGIRTATVSPVACFKVGLAPNGISGSRKAGKLATSRAFKGQLEFLIRPRQGCRSRRSEALAIFVFLENFWSQKCCLWWVKWCGSSWATFRPEMLIHLSAHPQTSIEGSALCEPLPCPLCKT